MSTRSEDRLRRLQRISLDLAAAGSIDEVVGSVVEALDAPVAAPSRSLWLQEGGRDVLELVAHRGMPEEAADRFRRIPLSADLPGAVAARERRTVVSATRVEAVEQFAGLRDVPRSTTGFLAIPLLGGQGCIGVLGIGIDDALDERDLDFFEAVAAQVAQTIIRVRLTERDRRRRDELEFLANLTDTALSAADHHDLMAQVCARAVPMLGDWCSLYYLPESASAPLVASWHVDPGKAAYIETLRALYPYDRNRPTGVPAVIRTGRPQLVRQVTPELIDEATASSPVSRDEALDILEHLGITSAITVPLRTKWRVVGAMQFVSSESGRRYDDDDLALAEAVAGRLAEALDAAWVADQQRTIAVTLQEALLPPALPAIPGIEIAARYWPAGTNHVGGDFYDVFSLSEDRWALVIGDACGTGPDAAALTSIARHTVRAAARHGADAADVMTWLNDAVLQSNRDLYCTACYATLDGGEGSWRFTSTAAGHPLPIVATGSGTGTLGGPGTLLGVLPALRTTTAETALHTGDVVVLYTDGVTDLPPPCGIGTADLVALVDELRGRADAAEIADAIYSSLLERVADHSRHDDIALLVVRVA
jgi:serine phosphatase RsbU (regulator of sigma subunit)